VRITHDEYDNFIQEFAQEEFNLLEQLKNYSSADNEFFISSSYLLELVQRAEELFLQAEPAQKQQLLKFVLANAKIEGQKLIFNLKKPFEGILAANQNEKWLPVADIRKPRGLRAQSRQRRGEQ